jgi:hypothetical protein
MCGFAWRTLLRRSGTKLGPKEIFGSCLLRRSICPPPPLPIMADEDPFSNLFDEEGNFEAHFGTAAHSRSLVFAAVFFLGEFVFF